MIDDDLSKWFKKYGLEQYESRLRAAGLNKFAFIKDLDDEMIEDLMQETKMKKLHKKAFKRAILDAIIEREER